MTTALRERAPAAGARNGAGNGGLPARRAVIRWAFRMFRREWRQQLLVLALIVVAVAATIIGAAVATNTPPPANAGFGTAQDRVLLPMPDPHLAAQIAALRQHFGPVDVIENQAIAIPGTINTYYLRAQNPRGPYGQPMLSLVSGHYPSGPGQVAVTGGVASAFHLKVGDLWRQGGTARRVTGIVQNPQSLLEDFALVAPGQVKVPDEVTVLFDAPGVRVGGNNTQVPGLSTGPIPGLSWLRPLIQTPRSVTQNNIVNPETISIAGVTVGMLLIALVAVGGFTVLAQRRLRAIGMLASIGATDKHVRLVVRANGVVVGLAGAIIGLVVGLAGWLAYRSSLESSAHHLIGAFHLPWLVVVLAMALAVLATYFAASRPARSVARMPVVAALSGRPAPPKRVRRSALPGLVFLVIAFILFTLAAEFTPGQGSTGKNNLELAGGFLALVIAVILLAPFCLAVVGRLGRRAPIASRLALRDLSRYRARSGSALAAISLGALIAAIICIEVAARYGNMLDYAGPNLASNQIIVYTPNGNNGPAGSQIGSVTGSKLASMEAHARGIASALGSHDLIQLDSVSASLQHAAPGRSWSGPIYVATPQLLRAFGISASQVNPSADILTMRPGLSGYTKMQLVYNGYLNPQNGPPGGNSSNSFPCPKGECLANPVIQEISSLPSGTSAPNTVITEHAIRTLGLHVDVAGWLIQTPHPPTATQISQARLTAGTAGMSIETKSSTPSSSEILNWATLFGIVLSLGILAMTIGLIRSETASDLRTLTATGASGRTRRTITAATAGALALLGAVLGTAAAYVASVAYARGSSLDGLSSLGNVPVRYLLLILVGMPLIAAVAGWLLAGREPPAIARQPLE
ncbi:MAG TPA: FtsX-like permease family protein [Streptosporangiaceae bacterium]|nr:FtsX-like permease family protein [Streptosporangiaceae bacterium]